MNPHVERHEHRSRLLVALVLAVLALVVGVGAAADAHTSTSQAEVAGTRVAAHDHLAGPLVEVGEAVRAGELRRTTTPAAVDATGSRVAPQTPPGCDDSVVIGESTRRTQAAAAAFGARFWAGLEGPGVNHAAVCAANEVWLRGEISRGSHVIDIGIDASRLGSRSPYYELEQRIIAETGYPVERRPWPSSPNQYEPEDPGPCP